MPRRPADRPPRRLHRRPYADESYRRDGAGRPAPGTPGWIRSVVGGLVLLLLADVALGSLLVRLDRADSETALDGPVFGFDPAAQEALAEQPGSAELIHDLEQVAIGVPDAFLGWRFDDEFSYHSEQLNISEGVRETRRPSGSGSGDPVEVWLFGGSTLYGSGQADGATIPSDLVALAEADGLAVQATNFGRPAYANWQEVQLLEQQLADGTRPHPDVVVFYDGFNDLTLQTQFGVHDQPIHLFSETTGLTAPPTGPTVARTVRSWWADHSATALAVGRIRGCSRTSRPSGWPT
ncbi:MAG: hypothetical protein R2695_09980 [Acidimicrobiales bacterium]